MINDQWSMIASGFSFSLSFNLNFSFSFSFKLDRLTTDDKKCPKIFK